MTKHVSRICALAAFIVLSSLMLSSCDKDEKSTTIYYTYGFSSISGGTTSLTEMSLIENTFKSNMGISNTPFSLTGTSSECDALVKEAGAKTTTALSGKTWKCTLVFDVTNSNTTKVVYTFSVTPSN